MEVMNRLFGKSNPELAEVMAEMALAKPPVKSSKLQQHPADPKGDGYMMEYAELASVIGIMPPELSVEAFKAFMVAHDLPIYSLSEVIAYMDAKASKESKQQAGWEWRPLRAKDALLLHSKMFGSVASWQQDQYGRQAAILKPASDYFVGPHTQTFRSQENGETQSYERDASSQPYDRAIPLHALRRIALIEKEHSAPVAFFVSDYALAPAIPHPDPFLLAVVPNLNLAIGTGRFVIDFWDEPGFGIDKMLK